MVCEEMTAGDEDTDEFEADGDADTDSDAGPDPDAADEVDAEEPPYGDLDEETAARCGLWREDG